MILLSYLRDELETLVKTNIPGIATQFTDNVASRVDWRSSIEKGNIVVPTGIWALPMHNAEEWGLGNQIYTISASFFLIASTQIFTTTLSATNTGTTQTLTSVTGLQIGMRLFFDHSSAANRKWAIITNIAGNVVTLDRSIVGVSGESVYIQTTDWIEYYLQKLRDALWADGTYFQVPDPPVIDTSASSPANDIFIDMNAPYQVGVLNVGLLMGAVNSA